MTMQITTTLSANPTDDAGLAEILANPGFGTHFSDHMLTVEWTPEQGWHAARVTPYGPLTLDPATAVLHYAQEIFEGMKAYRHDDGSVWTFRPEENAARMVRSARRLALPELPVEDFVGSVDALIRAAWLKVRGPATSRAATTTRPPQEIGLRTRPTRSGSGFRPSPMRRCGYRTPPAIGPASRSS